MNVIRLLVNIDQCHTNSDRQTERVSVFKGYRVAKSVNLSFFLKAKLFYN